MNVDALYWIYLVQHPTQCFRYRTKTCIFLQRFEQERETIQANVFISGPQVTELHTLDEN